MGYIPRVTFKICPKISRAASESDICDNFELLQKVFIRPKLAVKIIVLVVYTTRLRNFAFF